MRQLKGKVESYRREIVGLERELGREHEELKRLDREWLSLLVKMVQGGYFMSDGMRGVFREMGRNGYIPKQEDFPSFMDSVSVKCMLKVYSNVMKEEQEKKTRQRIVSCYQPRQVSTSIRSIREIAKQPKLKQIYQGTKDYITTWLRNENWREESHLKQLPAIGTKTLLSLDEVKEWQS